MSSVAVKGTISTSEARNPAYEGFERYRTVVIAWLGLLVISLAIWSLIGVAIYFLLK